MDISAYDFAYYDHHVAVEYLTGLRGSVSKPTRGTGRSKRKRGGKAALRVGPLEAGGELGKEEETETEYEIQQPKTRQFYELRAELAQQKLLTTLEQFDIETWEGLEEGRFVELRGRLEVSPLDSFLDMADQIYNLGVSTRMIDPSDESTKKTVAGISMLTQSGAKGLSIFLYPTGGAGTRHRFFSDLRRQNLRVPLADLNARFRLLGRIRTVLERREVVDLLKLPGSIRLPRSQLRQLVQKFAATPFTDRQLRLSDLKVTAPAIEITTIAVYR